MVPESEKCSKDCRDMVKGHRSQHEVDPSGQSGTFEQKINNDYWILVHRIK